ncbi:MAG TPA: DUF885 domain-containing protein [Marmoricola sp.]|nr:DUF885 domain-containing protein [Marmoricola sp.]
MPKEPTAGERLAELGERYFRTQHTYDPYNATLLGLTEFDGLAGDPSAEASARAAGDLAEIAREAECLDPEALDEPARVDREVLIVLARGAGQDAQHSLWAANVSAKGYVSRQGLVFQAVPAMTAADAESADRYLTRLAGLPGFLDALGRRYLEETALGRISTAFGVVQAAEQLEGALARPLDEDALLAPARTAGDARVLERAEQIVREDVRPAMASLAGLLRTELLLTARPDDRVGIRFVPGGEQGYADAVARHTTTDLGPEQIHQIGLERLAELRDRWVEIGRRALGESDYDTIVDRLRNDPALRFDSSAQIVQTAQGALERAQAVQDDWFPSRSLPGCAIEEVDPVEAAHAALAYYRPPAVDGSRPGAYCVLTTEPQERFRYEYEALTYHESVPGHHLQLATAQLLDLPRYRRHLDVEACSFNEGWGLYAEQLAEEMGLYIDDLSLLGMLSMASLRACRLVIDTGLHFYGWSRQQAVDFAWRNTATPMDNIRSEVDRYVSWPGQALAYLIGQREITRLRQRSEAELGPRFDVKEFHRVVLGAGAVPLSVLDRNVARWAARRPTEG